MGETIGFVRAAFARGLFIGRGDARFLLVAVAIVAIPAFAADLWVDDDDLLWANIVVGLATLYLQLFATYRTLARIDLAPPGYRPTDATQGRLLGAWLLQLVAIVGIVAGGIMLVVPGIVLLLLWSLSLAAFAGEGLSPFRALGRSARLARPMLGRLLALSTGWAAAALVASVLAALPGMLWHRLAIVSLFLADIVSPAALILGAVLFAVAYGEARGIEAPEIETGA